MNSSPEYEPSQTLLLEQYKLFVEMADRNSERRGATNKFYITILTGLLALTSWAATNTLCEVFNIVLLFISILSLALCGIWYLNINSYKQMNSGKFTVIHEMEKQLPFPCYGREWEILESGKNHAIYVPYTKIEKFIPIILAVPYAALLLYAIHLTFF
ncbi:MAG: hypothetical protein GX999_07835 [Bacteroidales bacterium]|nr:hypothetical protein [Bacteroidales bacterium]